MTDRDLSRKFLALLEERRGLLLPGAGCALAARVIAETGFDALYITGAGIANTLHGVPDIGLVSLSEVTANITSMREACPDLPIFADGDTGFGNAVNMYRTVQLYERAGANAIQIEDQLFPKKCGHFAGKAVIDAGEMVDKVKAAVDARRDENFVIVARTDSRAMLGLDAAIERVHMYHEAGAQATFVEAPQTLEEIERVAKETPGLKILNIVHGGKTPMPTMEQIKAWQFSGVLYANAALQASIRSMSHVLGHLKAVGSLAGVEDQLANFAERQRVVDKARFDALEERYASKANAG
ncbi:oxaloacetate decarboxylase [Sphingobium sp. HBC34]|uniref:Oxaloacetate decarboxylase n=1 Tax=Sphingobium cyanobacteriorum TaxID=3063954 RepID=A0ABT8ZQY6_9SPHN|nr:oxaloacetate decarboxylase [Sphingobium sp. HBC34]MDO7836364.1 oxaloacetate decarboxylase [Sphingobium sp. HBC34]